MAAAAARPQLRAFTHFLSLLTAELTLQTSTSRDPVELLQPLCVIKFMSASAQISLSEEKGGEK